MNHAVPQARVSVRGVVLCLTYTRHECKRVGLCRRLPHLPHVAVRVFGRRACGGWDVGPTHVMHGGAVHNYSPAQCLHLRSGFAAKNRAEGCTLHPFSVPVSGSVATHDDSKYFSSPSTIAPQSLDSCRRHTVCSLCVKVWCTCGGGQAAVPLGIVMFAPCTNLLGAHEHLGTSP